MIPAGINVAKFQYALGEAKRAFFRLRRTSDGSYFNANTAQSIYVSLVRLDDGHVLPPIYAVRESGFDDWLGGLVSIMFSASNVAAFPGVYEGRMHVLGTNDEPVFTGVRVDVPAMQRLEQYMIPGIGGFTGTAQTARATASVRVGMPVVATIIDGAATIKPAADPIASTDVLGIALGDAAAGYSVAWAPNVSVRREDWTPIAPTQQLLPNTAYLLDTAGTISPTGAGPTVGTSDGTGRVLVR